MAKMRKGKIDPELAIQLHDVQGMSWGEVGRFMATQEGRGSPYHAQAIREATIAIRKHGMVACPSCHGHKDNCKLCGDTGKVTERTAKDFGAES